MESTRTVADAEFNCYQAGQGPALILAHCSSGSHKQWRFALTEYGEDFSVIAPDLLGYGANRTWTSPANPYSVNDLDLLLSLIPDHGPFHLVGHSYGAVLCLEAARQLCAAARPPESLFLIEPPAAYLLRNSKKHWAKFMEVSGKCWRAVEQEKYARAAQAFMGYWIGHLAWFLTPRHHKSKIVSSMAKVAYEFGQLHERSTTFADYDKLSCPVTLISGSRSPELVRTLSKCLLSHLPNARQNIIKGAGHMSPYTHTDAVNQLLRSHLDWVKSIPSTARRHHQPRHAAPCNGDQ